MRNNNKTMIDEEEKEEQDDEAEPSPSPSSPSSPSSPVAASFTTPFNLHELESFLASKLLSLESGMIRSLFSPSLLERNNAYLNVRLQSDLLDSRVEEMSLWINHHNSELTRMKAGMEIIEKRNQSMEIEEKNQSKLYETLKGALDTLQLDTNVVQLLNHPDFSMTGLRQTLAAAKQLDAVLHRTIEGGMLEEMKAVKEQRHKYEIVRMQFTNKAEAAIEKIFQETAKKEMQDLHRFSSDLSLLPHPSFHSSLRHSSELLRYLERLAPKSFVGLRPKYVAAFRPVYEILLKGYFHAVKKNIAQETNKDTRWNAFPEVHMEFIRNKQNSRGGHVRRHSFSVSRLGTGSSSSSHASSSGSGAKTGPYAAVPPNQANKPLATQAFVQALNNVTPLCRDEEKFLNHCFGLSSDLSGDDDRSRSSLASLAGSLSSVASNFRLNLARVSAAASSDASDLSSCMFDLFRVFEPELKELAAMGYKMDAFYTLEMMVTCEKIMQKNQAQTMVEREKKQQQQHEEKTRERTASPMGRARGGSRASASTPHASPFSVFLEGVLTNVSTYLKLSFTSFIDSEIEWLNSLHPNPKRCGVLRPFLKFPNLVERMEKIVNNADRSGANRGEIASNNSGGGNNNKRSQAADTSYQKLSSALFRWLDSVARMDEKYTDVVIMENAHFYYLCFSNANDERTSAAAAPSSSSSSTQDGETFSSSSSSSSSTSSSLSNLSVPALTQSVSKSRTLYLEHLHRYVSWHIEYEMGGITKFWNKLDQTIKNILPEEVPFASELSKHDLRALSKGPLSNKMLCKSLSNVLKRVEKHMPKNPVLIETVWNQIRDTFLAKLAHFEKLVADCYQNEKLQITQSEVNDMFTQLLIQHPPSGAAAIAAASAD